MTRRTLTVFMAGCFAGGLMVAALASGALRGQVAYTIVGGRVVHERAGGNRSTQEKDPTQQ